MKIIFISQKNPRACRTKTNSMFPKQVATHQARFEVLMTVTMNSNAFCNVTPCSLVEIYRRFRRMRCFHLQGTEVTILLRFYNEHDSGKVLRILSKFILDYTASHPRIRRYSIADYSENQTKYQCRVYRMSGNVKRAEAFVFQRAKENKPKQNFEF